MDSLKDNLDKPNHHRIWVTRNNFAVFGESTSHGVITANCETSMKQLGMNVSEWVSEEKKVTITMGGRCS